MAWLECPRNWSVSTWCPFQPPKGYPHKMDMWLTGREGCESQANIGPGSGFPLERHIEIHLPISSADHIGCSAKGASTPLQWDSRDTGKRVSKQAASLISHSRCLHCWLIIYVYGREFQRSPIASLTTCSNLIYLPSCSCFVQLVDVENRRKMEMPRFQGHPSSPPISLLVAYLGV